MQPVASNPIEYFISGKNSPVEIKNFASLRPSDCPIVAVALTNIATPSAENVKLIKPSTESILKL